MHHDRYTTFADFYPYYLSEHRTAGCRRLHVLGSTLVLGIGVTTVVLAQWWLLLLMPIVGYGFAWLGHLAFEHNKPATFAHPWYSLMADFVMLRDVIVGRIRF